MLLTCICMIICTALLSHDWLSQFLSNDSRVLMFQTLSYFSVTNDCNIEDAESQSNVLKPMLKHL